MVQGALHGAECGSRKPRGRAFLPVIPPCPEQLWVPVEKLVPSGPWIRGKDPGSWLVRKKPAVSVGQGSHVDSQSPGF